MSTDALKKAAHEGWLACRREVFSLSEATLNAGITSEFERGRCFEAKGIAKALGSMNPEDSNELRAAIAKAEVQS